MCPTQKHEMTMDITTDKESDSSEGVPSNSVSQTSSQPSSVVENPWGDCLVCSDKATGKHYGVPACEGCKGFFKRSVRRNSVYVCRAAGSCKMDRYHRNRCQHCRLKKCLQVGMRKEAVQCERKPLNMVQSRTIGNNYNSENTQDSNGIWNNNMLAVPTQPTAMDTSESEHVPQLLTQEMIEFKITVPSIGISAMSLEYMYEIATRLLFLTVDWARKMPFFSSLENEDQLTLLQNTWRDLFLLGIGQCSSSFPLSPLLTLASGQLKNEPGQEHSTNFDRIIGHIMNVKDFVYSLERLDLDTTEYAHMKIIALCNPDFQGLVNPKRVAEVQEKAHNAMRVYIKNKDPNTAGRFAKLLLRLPATRVIDSLVIEQLFFAPLIGDVHIENIMANIMNNTFRI